MNRKILTVASAVALLVGLGVACWLVGRTPLTAPANQRRLAWSGAPHQPREHLLMPEMETIVVADGRDASPVRWPQVV
jgi:hypothetical protein